MRKVTEKTFKAYAKEAVKQLNTLEIRATLSYSCMGAEISLYREGSALVGHISISPDGLVRAKDLVRNESFSIEPLHNTMKDLFNAMYEAVNSRLDDNGFKAEEKCELTDEQIANIAGRLYAGGWTMLDVDMIAAKTGTNKKTAHRIMIQIGMYINHTLPEDIAQESEKTEKQEGRTLTVTLHPEDEEEEITITYEDAKGFHHVVGQEALEIEKSTDGISIDKDHVYIVIEFLDGSEATFRRSSVVRIAEEGHVLLERDPEPTPEEADREVTYIDFKPEQDYSEEKQKEIAETVAGIGLELLEEQLTELEKLEDESDKADDAWDKDPLNAELEAASDKAYEKEWKQYMDTVKTLVKLIDTDTKTARQMLQRGSKNREKVWNYLKRRKIYESK